MAKQPQLDNEPDDPDHPKPKPPAKKRRFSRRTIMIIVGAIVLLFLCNGIISLFNDEPAAEVAQQAAATDAPADAPAATERPTRTPRPTEPPAPTDTPAPPTPTLEPGEALRAAVAETLGNSNRDVERLVSVEDVNGRIEVDWAINDNLTENLTQGGAQLDAANILRAVAESGYDYEFVLLRGTFPLVDQFGNVEETKVVELFFNRATVDRINFANFDHRNVYDIADSAQIHPAFVRE